MALPCLCHAPLAEDLGLLPFSSLHGSKYHFSTMGADVLAAAYLERCPMGEYLLGLTHIASGSSKCQVLIIVLDLETEPP